VVLSLNVIAEPVGSMKQWLPATTGAAGALFPQNWLICDGSIVADSSSPYNGIALPDTRAKFRRCHSTMTNLNFSADNAYKAGGTIPSGGTDSNNLSHSHSYNVSGGGHTHDLQNHTHGPGNLSGPGPDHYHTSHGPGGYNNEVYNNGSSGGNIGSIVNASNLTINTGNTATPSTNSTSSYGGFSINGSVNNNLGATENRPVYQEFVTIIKYK
jgi:hypothetical protein